jgi:hypothetical protein
MRTKKGTIPTPHEKPLRFQKYIEKKAIRRKIEIETILKGIIANAVSPVLFRISSKKK